MANVLSKDVLAIREAAEADLLNFIRLVAPHRVLGHVHEELITWWTRREGERHQIILLPRDHQKSAMVAYRVAWWITKYPDCRILYLSSTSNLAEKQLKMIKDILTSRIYQKFWPEMVNANENLRESWTQSEISVDHPKRRQEGVRDPTIFTGGLTTSLTGMHCDVAVLDDVVVQENAYTAEGRNKVKSQYSLLSSIESADAQEWVVGTRYHPVDLYSDMMAMVTEVYDSEGNIIARRPIYETFERQVEDRGDGTGQFLWSRQRRKDGKFFGFDSRILAEKRNKYLDRSQFRAQYYNDPNDPDAKLIDPSRFQYFAREQLKQQDGRWWMAGRPLNVFAAIDFAYSRSKRADYTSLVVIGIDHEGRIYVLDIVRFKTSRIVEYFEKVRESYLKWDFRKIRAEVTAAQAAIVSELKEYIRKDGLAISVDEHRPNRYDGSKEERIASILEPRYDNMSIWHYKGGLCQALEEELIAERPPHDDIKDALACAVSIAIPPRALKPRDRDSAIVFHSRFGGVAVG